MAPISRKCGARVPPAILDHYDLGSLLRDTIDRMAQQRRDQWGLGRFGEPGMLILLALSGGPKHGYAITSDIEDRLGMHIGPGTLYGSISRLDELGLISALPSDDRRRPYEITATGREALIAHLEQWERVTTVGRTRLAWG